MAVPPGGLIGAIIDGCVGKCNCAYFSPQAGERPVITGGCSEGCGFAPPIFFGSCPKKTGRARSKRKALFRLCTQRLTGVSLIGGAETFGPCRVRYTPTLIGGLPPQRSALGGQRGAKPKGPCVLPRAFRFATRYRGGCRAAFYCPGMRVTRGSRRTSLSVFHRDSHRS